MNPRKSRVSLTCTPPSEGMGGETNLNPKLGLLPLRLWDSPRLSPPASPSESTKKGEGEHDSLCPPQEPDTLVTINRGALIGPLVVAVAVAMVIIISLLMVRRKPYGTISHGIVEVTTPSTPHRDCCPHRTQGGVAQPGRAKDGAQVSWLPAPGLL